MPQSEDEASPVAMRRPAALKIGSRSSSVDHDPLSCHGACQGQIISGWCDRHRRHDHAIAQASTPKGTRRSSSFSSKTMSSGGGGSLASLVDNVATPTETGDPTSPTGETSDSAESPANAPSVTQQPVGPRRFRRERTPSLVALMMQKHEQQQLQRIRMAHSCTLSQSAHGELNTALSEEAKTPSPAEVHLDSPADSPANPAVGFELFEEYLEAVHKINKELESHKAAEQIIQQTCHLLKCARATIFYVDHQELILVIAKGARNIRLPKTKGIAGWVATTGETLNIRDAWKDERFDNTSDLATGFRTASVLATPVVDDEGNIVAVLQCINKHPEGPPADSGSGEAGKGSMGGDEVVCEDFDVAKIATTFSEEDEILAKNLARHCSTALRNAQLYEQSKRSEAKVSAVLEIVEMLNGGLRTQQNTNSLIFTISNRANQIVEADRCTLYLADQARQQLVVMQGDVDFRFPWTKGLAGHCCVTGETVNIRDCYLDERFNQEVDKSTGYRTRSMLCLPIFGEDQKTVIGVLQLINRLDEEEFLQSDITILQTLLSIAGPILEKSRFFTDAHRQQVSEHDRIKRSVPRMKSPKLPPMAGIRE